MALSFEHYKKVTQRSVGQNTVSTELLTRHFSPGMERLWDSSESVLSKVKCKNGSRDSFGIKKSMAWLQNTGKHRSTQQNCEKYIQIPYWKLQIRTLSSCRATGFSRNPPPLLYIGRPRTLRPAPLIKSCPSQPKWKRQAFILIIFIVNF